MAEKNEWSSIADEDPQEGDNALFDISLKNGSVLCGATFDSARQMLVWSMGHEVLIAPADVDGWHERQGKTDQHRNAPTRGMQYRYKSPTLSGFFTLKIRQA